MAAGRGVEGGQRDRRDNRLSDCDKLSSNGTACLPSSLPSSIPTYLVDSFTGGGLETWIRRSKHWQHLCVSNGEGEAEEDRENRGRELREGKAQE